MRTDIAQPIRLADYRPTDYLIDTVDLDVKLDPHATRVVARLAIRPNPKGHARRRSGARRRRPQSRGASCSTARPLDVAGEFRHARPADHRAAAAAALHARNRDQLDPSANSLSDGPLSLRLGLLHPMRSRRFSPDHLFSRPPRRVQRLYGALEAEIAEAPCSSSATAIRSSGKVEARPPFRDLARSLPKPSYLFALVGGDLGSIQDEFTTASGRKVVLAIHVEQGKEESATYAMERLKRSMRWDEISLRPRI